ncbi:MAG: 4-alpha-glucanotransferase [Oscillospiraceae bacterium]|jgi:4-alpha-glucanotransferase|nr:4-alpha-glucanotransferase [Oscillospiraceae bacterium]
MKNIPKRAAGVLMPAASLHGEQGIGTFGAEARQWIDFLAAAGQKYWQILPLNPIGFGGSPYQSESAFAGNPYFIDLDLLCEEGLLERGEYSKIDWGNRKHVDYLKMKELRGDVLRIAFGRFEPDAEYSDFCRENSDWLDGYASYSETKSDATDAADFCRFVQYKFASQWSELRKYAHSRGVEIIGDIPIYVSSDSADFMNNPEVFQLDENGEPSAVAGCPPDSFSKTGLLWGNPLYDWDALKANGFDWWVKRVLVSFKMIDVLRIDHFRGFDSYYSIPPTDETAEFGDWRTGPGMDFVNAIRRAAPQARIIAEDLGFLTNSVRKLLKQSGFPGMKVLQFAFDSREGNDYSPHNYGTNCVVYTGTHDNDTVLGWSHTAAKRDITNAMSYLGVKRRKQLPRAMIRLAMQSPAGLAVIPMQDWLDLGSEARINIPSTVSPDNWSWRIDANMLTDRLAREMREIAELTGR